jgi:hypothetical protein
MGNSTHPDIYPCATGGPGVPCAAMTSPPTSTRRRVLSTKVDVDTYDALTRIAESEDRTVSWIAARILADAVKAA